MSDPNVFKAEVGRRKGLSRRGKPLKRFFQGRVKPPAAPAGSFDLVEPAVCALCITRWATKVLLGRMFDPRWSHFISRNSPAANCVMQVD